MKTQNRPVRFLALFGAVVLAAGIMLQVIPPKTADAAQITNRSLTLLPGTTDGGSKAGGVVNLFSFSLPTSASTGSIRFQYCTTASGSCTMPTGLVTTSATLFNETGATGFTINNTTNGSPYLTRTATGVTGPQAATYQLNTVTNPTVNTPTFPNYTFFVRISTFASTDTTGASTDTGTVTASTAEQIVLDGTMPESLVFCTGETIGLTGGVPDCATATDGIISFNQLFSPTDTATATSQMAASTNAGAGYAVTVNGPTLTSGSNTVSALASPSASVKGVSQFGLNLKANTTAASNPAIGTEVAPAANGTNYKGVSQTNYNTADTFTFATGGSVAASNSGGAGGTDSQIFTASYIVNVPGSQPAGTYTTTLTYICTPTF